ncbi:MAG: aromatic amino acid ammonia-lyase, partial [Acidobacteriota bacterium]
MSVSVPVGSSPLTLEQVVDVARHSVPVEWAGNALARIARGRAALDERLAAGERIYGVNTGIGSNLNYSLTPEQAELLQHNLMRHLSCATGQPLPDEVVRGAMLLRLATFATGCSGVRPELCEALLNLLNAGVTPVVPRYGSVGASGDLMPSAYIARVLIGMGEARYRGERLTAPEALRRAGLEVIAFAPKEGLALINGTTMMTSVAALILPEAVSTLRALLRAIGLATEALEAPVEPYAPFVHEKKGHPGQIAVAAYMRGLVAGSGQQ